MKSLGGRWRGNTGTARCPAHDDHNPSLSVSEGKDGKLLVHCHAGCGQTEVIEALTAQGLWPKHADQPVQHASCSRGMSRAAPASASEPNFTHPDLGKPSRTWEYRDQAGQVLGYVVRFDRPDGSKTFRPLTPRRNSTGGDLWRRKGFDEPLPLFGLDQLSLRPDDPVLITEGEKAAEAAAHRGREGGGSGGRPHPWVGRHLLAPWREEYRQGRLVPPGQEKRHHMA